MTKRSTDQAFPFPVLVADIGGTNARFALVTGPEADAIVFPTVQTARFPDPIAAIESLGLGGTARAPKTAIMAVAGPVTGDRVLLTNCPWTVAPRAMIERLGLSEVVLINDFEAQALSLPSLAGADVLQIGGGAPLADAAKVVLGPGTGLGVATLVHALGRWIPIPGEGGHVELAPFDARDYAVWPHIERTGGRVTAETVLSGSGLLRLARAVAAADGVPCRFDAQQAVTEAALAGDPDAVETLNLFARALGRVAGDFALASLARGGVYIAGGVSLKIERFLTEGPFRAAFEAKAPHAALVASIPTYLVKHPNPALLGLGAFARAPHRFALELGGRHWRG